MITIHAELVHATRIAKTLEVVDTDALADQGMKWTVMESAKVCN